MDRSGERRDVGDAARGDAKEDPSQETPHTEASHKDEMEMDEESGGQGGDVVSHPEVDEDTEVDADDEDSKVTRGSRGKVHVKVTVGEKGVSWRTRSPTPSPNSRTLKLKWSARKNFCKHHCPPHGRS